uniref:F-box domain-containing protein n=1 Tax=Oryza meridionalis TaxID=40149 RepID=A0A0E0DXR1_9ORYZ
MACASAGKRDMIMNQPGHGGDVPVAKRRRCVEPAGAAAAGIPEDIVEEILLRLPVKSILRFRSVCKSWRAMVADPRFVRLQLDHSTTAARHRPPSMLILADCYPGHGVAADFALGMTWSSSPVATADEDDVVDWDAVDDGDDDDNLDDAVDDGDDADDNLDDAVDGNADDNWDINDGAIGLGGALHYNGLVLLSSMENSSMLAKNAELRSNTFRANCNRPAQKLQAQLTDETEEKQSKNRVSRNFRT